jgi:LacI family transcriptional regulator
MSITVKEIAEIANVSTATVSMVINNKPGISSPTRRKVLSIVESHGYNISPLKSSLAQNNGTIQLTIYKKHSQVVADTAFFEALIAGIESKTSMSGYQLTIKSVTGHVLSNDLMGTEGNGHSVDSILLLGTEMEQDDMLNVQKLDLPVLVLDACFMGINSNYVVIDNINGVYMGVNHLIDNGHRRIGYLQSSVTIQNFLERYEGYLKALTASNIHCNSDFTVPLLPTIEGAYNDMLAYLSGNSELPTAFFADNDIIAFGAMKA